jgi:hypothetical protein
MYKNTHVTHLVTSLSNFLGCAEHRLTAKVAKNSRVKWRILTTMAQMYYELKLYKHDNIINIV